MTHAQTNYPFQIVVDTREQCPFNFGDWPTVRAKLETGDYSINGLLDLVAIERKSIPDLVGCVGRERARFERELIRLRGYRLGAVIVEGNLAALEAGGWRGQVTATQVLGSVASWRIKHGIHFIYADDATLAAAECLRMLRKYHDYCKGFAKRFG